MKTKAILALLLTLIISLSATCDSEVVEVEDERINVEGKWACSLDDGAGGVQDYEIEITIDNATDDKIFISNFDYNGGTATGTLTGLNITVETQTVGNSTIFADGKVSADYQEINWTININGEDFSMVSLPGGISKTMLEQ